MFVPIDRDAFVGGTPEIATPGEGAVTGLPNGQQMPSSREVRAPGPAHAIIAV